jgi:hypothetical protein
VVFNHLNLLQVARQDHRRGSASAASPQRRLPSADGSVSERRSMPRPHGLSRLVAGHRFDRWVICISHVGSGLWALGQWVTPSDTRPVERTPMTLTPPPTSDRHRQPMPTRPQPAPPKAGNWFALLILGALAIFVLPLAFVAGIVAWKGDGRSVPAASSSLIDLSVSELVYEKS